LDTYHQYSLLDQINNITTQDSEGPAWNKFWLSLDNETESMMSGEGGSRLPQTPDARSVMSPDIGRPSLIDRGDSVLPNESASHHGADSPAHSALAGAQAIPLEDIPFPFKFKAPSSRVHRLQVAASGGIEDLISRVAGKLGSEVESIGGTPTFEDGKLSKAGFALSYLDNEGDTVSITTDNDLVEAIDLSRLANRDKVDLFVHDPEKPPLHTTLEPQPASAKPPSPPGSVMKERTRYFEEDEEEEAVERHHRQQPSSVAKQEELITGVPNDLLLPGAIITLAVVIVAVFALGRASNR
jgi:PB1 domain